MKKIIAILVCVVMAAALFTACAAEAPAESSAPAEESASAEASAPAEESAEASEPAASGEAKTIGYYKDAADDYYKAGYEVFLECLKADPETANWEVIDKVGQGTAQEQLAAVEDFITTGVDAIVVVQNSPEITAECITKANEAGIPYFALTHAPTVPAGGELAGFIGYDFVETGVMAGEDALNYNDGEGVKKLVMVEGKLGQGTASAQSLGFLQAYEEAGKDIGGTANDVAVNKTAGGADLEIVQWSSGDWMADPAKKVVADVITALGADGFDGMYVQNDEMMDGAIQAIEEAGLNPADYWLGSSNGKEKSWTWAEEGRVTMDVNQTPALEGDALYQMLKAYFNGEEYRQYIAPYLTPYNSSNVTELTLVPYVAADYMAGREAGDYVTDINNPKFTDATELITFN